MGPPEATEFSAPSRRCPTEVVLWASGLLPPDVEASGTHAVVPPLRLAVGRPLLVFSQPASSALPVVPRCCGEAKETSE